jgi:uncharacterized protein YfbU (UPF0304 family)
MKLTNTERLILSNQYLILSLLEPEKAEHRQAEQELRRGFYDTPYSNAFGEEDFAAPIPRDRLIFAVEVMEIYEDRNEPFYGFRDNRLTEFARYWGVVAKDGQPLSDEEYGIKLANHKALTFSFGKSSPESGAEAHA